MHNPWELITIQADSVMKPRNYPAVVSINDSSIAILGGCNQTEVLSSVIFYDTTKTTD